MPIVSVGQITIVDVNDGVDGLDGPALQIISSAAGFTYQDGVASPADQTISFTLLRQGLDNTEANWAASGATLGTNKGRIDITEYVFGLPGTGDGDTAYLTLAQFGTARQMSIGATVGSLAAYANVSRIGDSTAEAGATRNVLSGSWATATAYGVGDIVVSSGFRWICILAHISSGSVMPPVFPATANTYWRLEGARGALTTSRAIAGSSWVDAEAATAIADAGGVAPVQGDVVTLFNTTAGYSETRIRSSAGPWTALSVIFGGNVIVDNTLTASKIQASAITTDKLAANAVTAVKIAANTITASQIAANTITAAQIAANTITASQIAADTITAAQIAAGAITASEVAANAITASKVAVVDMTNIWRNPDFAGGSSDGLYLSAGGAIVLATDAGVPASAPTAYVFKRPTPPTSVADLGHNNWIAAAPGETFYFEATVAAETGTNGTLSFQMRYADATQATNLGVGVGSVLSAASYTTWTRFGATVTVPDTVSGLPVAYVRFYIRNNINASPTGAWYVTRVIVRRAANAEMVVDGAITAAKISAGAVTTAKLAAGAVTANEIAANAVTAAKIEAGAITTAKLAAGAVTANEIAASTITGGKIAAGTITGSNIAADTITAGQIAAGAISASEVAAGAITVQKLLVAPASICPDPYFADEAWWTATTLDANGWFFESNTAINVPKQAALWSGATTPPGTARKHLWSGNVTAPAVGTVLRLRARVNNGSNHAVYVAARFYDSGGANVGADITLTSNAGAGIQDLDGQGTVPAYAATVRFIIYNAAPGAAFSGGVQVSAVMLDVAASADLIVDGAITAAKISAGAVTTAKLAAGAVTANEIAAGAITTAKLAANAVTANEIAANAITAGKIAAGAVSASQIAAGAITTDKLLVTGRGNALNDDPACMDLSAWTVQNGTVNAATGAGGSAEGTYFFDSPAGGGNDVFVISRRFPINYLRTYSATAQLFVDAGNNRNMYVTVRMWDANGTELTGAATGWGGTYAGYTYGGLPTPGDWFRYGGQFGAGTSRPIPQSAKEAAIMVWFRYSTGSGSVRQAAQAIRCQEVTGADLIVDGSIIAGKLAANSIAVGTAAIQNGAIVNAMLGDATIQTAKIADGAITTAKIGDAQITNAKIGDAQITNAKINDLDAGKITAGTISAERIGASSITAGKIDSRGLDIKDASGNVVFSSGAGSAVSATSGQLRIQYPGGGSLNSDASSIQGSIWIILPQGWSSTMMRFEVEIYEYADGSVQTYEVGGYNYQTGSWINTHATYRGRPSRVRRVIFGYDNPTGRPCIAIGTFAGTWSYPKVTIRNFLAGHSNFSESLWSSGWSVSFETSRSYSEQVAFENPVIGGAFSGLDQITGTNVSTYIANAAINTAQIANAAITTALIANANITEAKIADANITSAKIGDAQVSTLKIAGNAVTVPSSSELTSEVTFNNAGASSGATAGVSILSFSMDTAGQPVLVFVNYGIRNSAATSGTCICTLVINSSVERQFNVTVGAGDTVTGSFSAVVISPGSGSYTVDWRLRAPVAGSNIYFATFGTSTPTELSALGAKR